MGLTRISDEAIAKKRDTVSRLKEDIRERETLIGQKDSLLWKHLGPAIANSIKATQEQIDYFLDERSEHAVEEYATVRSLRGAVKAYKHILEAVEVEGVIERKRAYLQELTEELKRAETEQ